MGGFAEDEAADEIRSGEPLSLSQVPLAAQGEQPPHTENIEQFKEHLRTAVKAQKKKRKCYKKEELLENAVLSQVPLGAWPQISHETAGPRKSVPKKKRLLGREEVLENAVLSQVPLGAWPRIKDPKDSRLAHPSPAKNGTGQGAELLLRGEQPVGRTLNGLGESCGAAEQTFSLPQVLLAEQLNRMAVLGQGGEQQQCADSDHAREEVRQHLTPDSETKTGEQLLSGASRQPESNSRAAESCLEDRMEDPQLGSGQAANAGGWLRPASSAGTPASHHSRVLEVADIEIDLGGMSQAAGAAPAEPSPVDVAESWRSSRRGEDARAAGSAERTSPVRGGGGEIGALSSAMSLGGGMPEHSQQPWHCAFVAEVRAAGKVSVKSDVGRTDQSVRAAGVGGQAEQRQTCEPQRNEPADLPRPVEPTDMCAAPEPPAAQSSRQPLEQADEPAVNPSCE